jgi:hypothetical protein
MTEADKPPLRDGSFPLLGKGPADWVNRHATNLLAGRLLRAGTEIADRSPHLMQEAIDKIERAWALTRDPKIAIQLATMCDRANRNDDALVALREASHEHPRHALLRHHAAITLLRHGAPDEIRDFFDSVLAIDPGDAFARFIVTLLDRYDGWVSQLAASIEQKRDGRLPFLISLPVWGATHSAYCARYLCATLLSPNNLAALARSHSVHIAVFTSAEAEKVLRADPLFCRLAEHAAIEFVHYGAEIMNYQASMEACYGRSEVYYSDNSLAFYYERNCKFALMSCAHYVALAAGRATDGLVSCLVADAILSDGALPYMAARMNQTDAVLVHSVQMHGKVLRGLIEELRGIDGTLQIPADLCSRLVVEHIPEGNLADTTCSIHPPLRIAWRVGKDGLLVHGNHYHPLCLRPSSFAHPLGLSIDPVDSRFIDRTSLQMDRIHLVQDASIACLSIDDDPILEPSENSMGSISVPAFALWLWGYWGRLRGQFFRIPLRFGNVTQSGEWERTERAAAAIVEAIVDRSAELDANRRAGKSWRLFAGDP